MMEYEHPQIKVIRFEKNCDVITTSLDDNESEKFIPQNVDGNPKERGKAKLDRLLK